MIDLDLKRNFYYVLSPEGEVVDCERGVAAEAHRDVVDVEQRN